MKLKRTIGLSMILMVLLLVSTACGSGQSVALAAESAEVSAQATPAPTEEAAEEPAADAMDDGSMRENGAVVTVHELGEVIVHNYLAPEQVFASNTHIIELANSLVLFDTQFLLPYALDFRAYADSLGKPIDRLIITHAHPDHFLGSEAFADVDIYALAPVAAAIEANGQAEVDEKQAQFGDAIASTFVVPMVLEPGTVEIDGVLFEFEAIHNAEAEIQAVVKLPDHGVIAVGDIVYSGIHLILAGNPVTWTEALEALQADSTMYPLVLPGHGVVTGPSVYDTNIAWLAKAGELMGTVTSGEAFKAGLVEAFPDLGNDAAIDFVLPFLFPVDASEAADSADESGPTAEELGFALVEVADGLYSFGDGGAYGAFLVTDEGVIVMDTVNTTQSRFMMDAIKSVTDQPVKYLLYSHNHWDHIGGGQLFKDAGAIVLAHQDTYDWLATHPAPNPDVVIPDLTWNGARYDLVLGGKTVELYHFGPSQGEGMTVFRFPAEETIFTVDLVVPKRVGFVFMPDFTPRGWMATLGEMEKLEFETVMFAHNAPFGPRSAVTEQREFLEDLQTEIVTRMQAGEDPFQIVETIELPKYQDWAGYDAWLSLNAWRFVLEMFMGV